VNDQDVINKVADFVKQRFESEHTGHDWWHMYRVWRLAKHIGRTEGDADMFVVELGALLHDVADWKFHDDEEEGPRVARVLLESLDVDEKVVKHIEDIIRNVSFKGAKVANKLTTKEGQIVHDADKLDAIGAIGVARAFAYGGSKHRPLHDPTKKPTLHASFEDYKKGNAGTVNHFHEKLLLLKDRMFTKTGKELAEHRHKFMENYLEEFYKEWNGEM
jgi:uncharacterized protein